MQMKIRRHIEYMHEEQINGSQRGEILLNSLSQTMRKDLNEDIYSNLLMKIPFFNNFDIKFISKLSQNMKEVTLTPEEILFEVF